MEDSEEMIPPLEAGDRLDQKTFHERYEAMPPHIKAELIGGVVYMPSPLKPRHGRMHTRVMTWLGHYEEETPGVEACDNTTAILGPESEPQPDGYLIVLPTCGGQTSLNSDGYYVGPPELIAEVSSTSQSIDLHGKRSDYEQAGVKEYIVITLRKPHVYWFIARNGRFEELAPGPDGLLRSETFPGLWLDPAALLRRDGKQVRQVLQQGLASPEHAAFVARLAQQGTPPPGP
jgi:Uma2 family endonuclease